MLPVFGANLLQALYGTVDLMVVGQFASTADVSAVSTFSAQNVGAGEYKRARSSMYLGMIWTFAVGLAVFLFSFSHGALLARLFSDDKDVISRLSPLLRSGLCDRRHQLLHDGIPEWKWKNIFCGTAGYFEHTRRAKQAT